MEFIFFIIGIVFIVLLFKALFSYKLKLQTVNCYTGGLGSGKTLNAVKTAIKLQNRSKLNHYLFSWNLGLLPKYKGSFNIREIYSNFPILVKYHKKPERCMYSTPLTREHITGDMIIKENSIVIVDEAGTFFPFQAKRSNPDLIWDLTYFRQYHNSTLIICVQSIGNVDISIRRVVNVIYNFSSYRNMPFRFYTIDVQKINYMEDVVVNTNNINEDNTLKIIGRHFKNRRYDSRYMKNYYMANKEIDYKFTSLQLNPNDDYLTKEKFKNLFYQGK